MGTLRIHFTAADLSRTRLSGPDPAWEIVCSLHRLQTRARHPSYRPYAGWHHRARQDLHRTGLTGVVAGRLAPIAPMGAYFPDFLTPAPGVGAEECIARITDTPAARMRAELSRLRDPGRGRAWVGDLAAGRAGAVRELGDTLRRYHDVAVAPFWDQITVAVTGDRAARGAQALDAGLGHLFAGLGPDAGWAPPVLSVAGYPHDRDLRLDGRGITLVPSYFCWGVPIALADAELPPVLVYAARRPGAGEPDDPARRLGPLIGRTRLAVLEAAACGATTGELARRTGISPGTASHHATVLREAGLIASTRHANLMLHHLTALGDALLGGKGVTADDSRV